MCKDSLRLHGQGIRRSHVCSVYPTIVCPEVGIVPRLAEGKFGNIFCSVYPDSFFVALLASGQVRVLCGTKRVGLFLEFLREGCNVSGC